MSTANFAKHSKSIPCGQSYKYTTLTKFQLKFRIFAMIPSEQLIMW